MKITPKQVLELMPDIPDTHDFIDCLFVDAEEITFAQLLECANSWRIKLVAFDIEF